MPEWVHVENFRCFRYARVRLGPLTALVGPNASGKTALLHAIAGLFPGSNRDVWQRAANVEARVVWEPTAEVRFNIKGVHGTPQKPKGQYLHLDVTRMRAPLELQEATELATNGSNLVNVIATLPRRTQDELSRDLCRLVPVLQDVTPRPASTGKHRLVFQDRWKPAVWYEPSEVSDGTLLALGLLALQYQEQSTDLVAIEEPEHGLHPYLLGELVATLRKLANGEGNRRPLQIVLATQSSELLEFLEPGEVRFLSRRAEDGAVVVEEAPTDTDEWRAAYEAHQESLGSMWLSGGLGGVPTGG